MRENTAQHISPFRQPVGGGVVATVNGNVSLAGSDKVEQSLLLLGGEFEFRVAAVHVYDQDAVF